MNIKIEHIEKRIVKLIINSPQTLNALNSDIIDELEEKIDILNTDTEIKIIIITGVGKSFVAGANISEMSSMTPEEAKEFALKGSRVFRKLELIDKIVVAEINGYALGGGLELAMACDIRIASENAILGLPETSLGIIPGFSGILRLKNLIGESKAKELIFLGSKITANQANSYGLINKVVKNEELEDNLLEMCDSILKNSFNAIIVTKKSLNILNKDLDDLINSHCLLFSNCFLHTDQKEGMNAFLSKTKPNFK